MLLPSPACPLPRVGPARRAGSRPAPGSQLPEGTDNPRVSECVGPISQMRKERPRWEVLSPQPRAHRRQASQRTERDRGPDGKARPRGEMQAGAAGHPAAQAFECGDRRVTSPGSWPSLSLLFLCSCRGRGRGRDRRHAGTPCVSGVSVPNGTDGPRRHHAKREKTGAEGQRECVRPLPGGPQNGRAQEQKGEKR